MLEGSTRVFSWLRVLQRHLLLQLRVQLRQRHLVDVIDLVVVVDLLTIHRGLVRLAHVYELKDLVVGGCDRVSVDCVVDVGYVLLLRRVGIRVLGCLELGLIRVLDLELGNHSRS